MKNPGGIHRRRAAQALPAWYLAAALFAGTRATLAQLPVVAAAVLDVLPLTVTLDRAGEVSPLLSLL